MLCEKGVGKMTTVLELEKLIDAANNLSSQDRQRLIDALTQQQRTAKHRITELCGLGKEIWQGQDAQEYVNAERDSWDNQKQT
jgi:hypothetical protein